MIKHRILDILPIKLAVILLLLISRPAAAQDSLGWEVYDSIKVDLKSGIISKKYLPFDVPFYLYGDTAGIESISLRIIDARHQACCLGELSLKHPEENPTACDCDCISVIEQRLNFFRTVREHDNHKPDSLINEYRIKKKLLEISTATLKYYESRISDYDKYLGYRQPSVFSGKSMRQINDSYEFDLLELELKSIESAVAKLKKELQNSIENAKTDDKDLIEQKLKEVIAKQVKLKRESRALIEKKRLKLNSDLLSYQLNYKEDSLNNLLNYYLDDTDPIDSLRDQLDSTYDEWVNATYQSKTNFKKDSLLVIIEAYKKEYQEEFKSFNKLISSSKVDLLKAARERDFNYLIGNNIIQSKGDSLISVMKMLSLKWYKNYLIAQNENTRLKQETKVLENKWKYLIRFYYKYSSNSAKSKKYVDQVIKNYERDITNQKLTFPPSVDSLTNTAWQEYMRLYKVKIEKDSLKLCPGCDFKPRECNDICGWKRDPVIGNGKYFYLAVPALAPNKDYKFFFQINRKIKNKEKRRLSKSIALGIMYQTDSLVSNSVAVMKNLGYNQQTIRDSILYNSSFGNYNTLINYDSLINGPLSVDSSKLIRGTSVLKDYDSLLYNSSPFNYSSLIDNSILEAIKYQIVFNLKDDFSDDIDVELRDVRLRDPFIVQRFLNKLISHKLYNDRLDSLYHVSRKNLEINKLVSMKILDNFESPKIRKRFFKEQKTSEYHLIDTLFRIRNEPLRIEGHPSSEVPASLLSYANLRQVNLRKLNKVNDLDTTTVNAYLSNGKKYIAYLGRLIKLFEEEWAGTDAKSQKLRVALFKRRKYDQSPYSVRKFRNEDQWIILSMDSLSRALYEQQYEMRQFDQLYRNYKNNLVSIAKTTTFLVDSVIENNRKIQLAVARQIGGITSANFKTRTDWYVTADVGLAYIPFNETGNPNVMPYFGANFNWRPLNRQAHYGLFSPLGKKRQLKYRETRRNERNNWYAFGRRMLRASSFVIGVTTTSLAVTDERADLLGNNMNLLLGYGLRLTDAARLGTGVVLVENIRDQGLTNRSSIQANWYFSLSFDIDVIEALGRVGELLKPN